MCSYLQKKRRIKSIKEQYYERSMTHQRKPITIQFTFPGLLQTLSDLSTEICSVRPGVTCTFCCQCGRRERQPSGLAHQVIGTLTPHPPHRSKAVPVRGKENLRNKGSKNTARSSARACCNHCSSISFGSQGRPDRNDRLLES